MTDNSPWIVSGTTIIANNASVTNPTPNALGRVGEVTALPRLPPTF